MLNKLRKIVPVKIKHKIKSALGLPLTYLNPDWDILKTIGPVNQRHIVFDIGSHNGWFFHCWKDWCPEAEIHAFEPRKESVQKAASLYGENKDIRMNNIAVGDTEGEKEFHVLEESTVSSSFLKTRQAVWDEIKYTAGDIQNRMVSITTIDKYCSENSLNSIYLVKIDVQGFELNVLKGAINTLPHIDHIFVESGIRTLYEDAPCFTDVYDYLVQHGFHLMALRAWHRGNNVLIETDMLFRRNDLMPPVREDIDRVYEEIR